jgi:hypothetical protein
MVDTDNMFLDILSFRKMVTTSVLKVLYALVAICITLTGLWTMTQQFMPGLGMIIFGNLLWRISCESLILAFNIHQELIKISRKLS